MENEKTKTPEQYAEQEMNKKIGKAIANRQMKINKLKEEIRKLKSGEMLPEEEDSSDSTKKKEIVKERIIERDRGWYPYREAKPIPMHIEPLWDRQKSYTTTNMKDNICLCTTGTSTANIKCYSTNSSLCV